jgi:hypothetical protein
MPVRRTLIVLPGLDGSDSLLQAFKAAAEMDFEVRLVLYPADRCLGYAVQRSHHCFQTVGAEAEQAVSLRDGAGGGCRIAECGWRLP